MFMNLKRKINKLFSGDNLSIFLILFFFTLFSILIIWRLYDLQIVRGEEFRSKVVKSSQKYKRDSVFDRGRIYFKDGEELIPAAIQETGYSLIVNNKYNLFLKNNNPQEVYQKLSKIIDIDEKFFLEKTSYKNDPHEKLKSRLNQEEVGEIKKLGIKGFVFVQESWRKYPLNELGGKILGFLDSEKNGVAGLEKYYNKFLLRDFKKEKKNIFFSIFSQETDDFFDKKEIQREGELYTSIDINAQEFIEKELEKINQKYSSKMSFAIIMKPSTGEIIAMSDSEIIDFNLEKKDFRNKLVEYRYEPGSIIKPLIVAFGLDSNSINKDFSYNDNGCIFVKDDKICNYDKKARGQNVGLIQILKESLNLGMISIQRHIKNSVFLDYFLRFGLAEETGIDLPNELAPNISSLDYNIPINYATAAFGQGVSASPISMVRSLSIIANDGFLVTPHIVTEINYGEHIPEDINKNKKERVLSIEVTNSIKNILIEAVNQSASKQKFQRRGYSVAAKTGTAQIASEEGGYKEGVNLHTFFGFFPARAKPEDRYAIILYTFEPKAKYSSETLTEPFYNIVDFLISYYNIKPDKIK